MEGLDKSKHICSLVMQSAYWKALDKSLSPSMYLFSRHTISFTHKALLGLDKFFKSFIFCIVGFFDLMS